MSFGVMLVDHPSCPKLVSDCICHVDGLLSALLTAPAWYNWAKAGNRQVVMNARCGTNYSDFDVRVQRTQVMIKLTSRPDTRILGLQQP